MLNCPVDLLTSSLFTNAKRSPILTCEGSAVIPLSRGIRPRSVAEKEIDVAFFDNLLTRSGRRLRLLLTSVALVVAVGALPTWALAAGTPSLGSAQSFSVLGGSTVTNTGSTVVTGALGVYPGSAVTGFPPGKMTGGGSIHPADAVALQAQNDVTTAYNNLVGQACTGNQTGKDLGGLTLTSGVYCFSSSAQLTGMLTLDAQGSANSVFIFQVGTTLTTATNSSVRVINGGTNCNVYWKVGLHRQFDGQGSGWPDPHVRGLLFFVVGAIDGNAHPGRKTID